MSARTNRRMTIGKNWKTQKQSVKGDTKTEKRGKNERQETEKAPLSRQPPEEKPKNPSWGPQN